MVRGEQGAARALPPQRRRDRSGDRGLALIARVGYGRVGALALACFCAALPAYAITGTVVDPESRPIEGARVCYLSGDVELLCVSTDEGGYYELPDTELDRIRIGAQGYLIRILAAVDHPSPIALARSATLLARVKARTQAKGARSIGGEVFVIAPNGRRLGPFPASEAGVRIRSLEPGRVSVRARVEGHRQVEPVEVELIGGEEVVVEVMIAPESTGDGDSDPG